MLPVEFPRLGLEQGLYSYKNIYVLYSWDFNFFLTIKFFIFLKKMYPIFYVFLCPYHLLTLRFSPGCVNLLSVNTKIIQLLEKCYPRALLPVPSLTGWFLAFILASLFTIMLSTLFPLFYSGFPVSCTPGPSLLPYLGWVYPLIASTGKICGRQIFKAFHVWKYLYSALLSAVTVFLYM